MAYSKLVRVVILTYSWWIFGSAAGFVYSDRARCRDSYLATRFIKRDRFELLFAIVVDSLDDFMALVQYSYSATGDIGLRGEKFMVSRAVVVASLGSSR